MSLVTILFGPNRWKTILTASGHETDELQDKYDYLLHKGVRSRLRNEEDQAIHTYTFTAIDYRIGKPRDRSISLLIHEDDLSQAMEALNKYERPRYAAQTYIR